MLWLLAAFVLLFGGGWLLRRFLSAAPPPEETPPADPGGPDPDYERAVGTELDLHGVPPRDVGPLVDEFVRVSHEEGRAWIRIVHGKGIGSLRRTVRVHLERHPDVAGFGDAPGSGWGATLVRLAERERH